MKWIEYRFDTLPSTQDFLREKWQNGQNLVAVAAEQSQGKGTKNRAFECAKGGLWLSVLTFHSGVLAKDGFLMMSRAAVAVCKTIESYGLVPKIKWANDVLLDGKKVCGVLTENRIAGGELHSTLWGIGLNVNNPLSDEIAPIATTLFAVLGRELDLREVEERLLKNLFAPFSFEEYARRLAFVGEEVAFTIGETVKKATLVGVSERGELLLGDGDETTAYAYGEIALLKK